MKRVITSILLAAVVMLALGGCMSQFASSNGKLAYADIQGTSQGAISLVKPFIYIIHPDVFIIGEKGWESIDKDIEPELDRLGANAVRDLKLGYGATLIDVLLSSVVPLVNWGTYTIDGEAVRR